MACPLCKADCTWEKEWFFNEFCGDYNCPNCGFLVQRGEKITVIRPKKAIV